MNSMVHAYSYLDTGSPRLKFNKLILFGFLQNKFNIMYI